MEIRALTGFNETTRRRYGRSYSPLNGVSLGGFDPEGQVTNSRETDMAGEEKPLLEPSELKKYIKPILIITALGGLFYVLKKKKII